MGWYAKVLSVFHKRSRHFHGRICHFRCVGVFFYWGIERVGFTNTNFATEIIRLFLLVETVRRTRFRVWRVRKVIHVRRAGICVQNVVYGVPKSRRMLTTNPSVCVCVSRTMEHGKRPRVRAIVLKSIFRFLNESINYRIIVGGPARGLCTRMYRNDSRVPGAITGRSQRSDYPDESETGDGQVYVLPSS